MKKEIKQNIKESLINNRVYEIDELEKAHSYVIETPDGLTIPINFQLGGRYQENKIEGVNNSDLLYILKDNLEYFLKLYPDDQFNPKTLFHINKAIQFTQERAIDRDKKGTLGNNGEDYKKGDDE